MLVKTKIITCDPFQKKIKHFDYLVLSPFYNLH